MQIQQAVRAVRSYINQMNQANIEHVFFLWASGPVIGLAALIDYLAALQLFGIGHQFLAASEPLLHIGLAVFWAGIIVGYILTAEEMCHRFPDEVRNDRVVRWVRGALTRQRKPNAQDK